MVYQGPHATVELPPAVAGPAFLADGTEVWVRAVQASDGELVREFIDRESPGSLELRYFSAIRPVLAQEEGNRPSPPEERLCLLVLGDLGDRVSLLGLGEYVRTRSDPTVAEVAVVVAWAFYGRGIPSLLLARLARAARAYGMLRFESRFGSQTPEMAEMFRSGEESSHPPHAHEHGEVQIPLDPELGAGNSGTHSSLPAPGASGRPRPSVLRNRT